MGSQTISRWIRCVLTSAGIDAKYTSYSVRAATTSKAAGSGVPLEDILAAADWSSASIFEKFYHKNASNPTDSFAKCVLAPNVVNKN